MDNFLDGTIVKVGTTVCQLLDHENAKTSGEWLKFECMGDGATGATITLTQTNPDYPMSLCGIRVYGTLDPRALLDKEYLDYKYDIKYEEDRKEKQTEEQAELDQTIEDLETDYFSVDDDAEVLL